MKLERRLALARKAGSPMPTLRRSPLEVDGGRRHSPLQHVTDQRSKVEPEFCENQHCEDQRREDCLEAIE